MWHVWRRWRVDEDRGPAGPVCRGWSRWEQDAASWPDEEDAHDWAETVVLNTFREVETVVMVADESPYLARA
jgi:hypothetical protein